jgi:hypothetical protein
MAKRSRRGRDFWAELVGEFEEAGATEEHRAFAERHGVECDSFRRWLYRLRAEAAGRPWKRRRTTAAARTPWPLVEIQGRALGPVEGGFELQLPGGTCVRVPSSFDEDGLRRLLVVLGEARSS